MQLRLAERSARESTARQVAEQNRGKRHPTGSGIGWLLLGATEVLEEDKQRLRVVNHQLKAN